MTKTFTATLSEDEYNVLRRVVGLFMPDITSHGGEPPPDPWEDKIKESLTGLTSLNLKDFMGSYYNPRDAGRVAKVLRKLGWTQKLHKSRREGGGYSQLPKWYAPLPKDETRDAIQAALGGCSRTTIREVCELTGLSETDQETLTKVQRALVANRWEGEPGKRPLDLERVWRRS